MKISFKRGGKLSAVAAACALVAACAGASQDIGPVSENVCFRNPFLPNENHPLLTDIATQTLADLQIEVTDIFITNEIHQRQERRGPILLPFQDDIIIGYTAWANVSQCDRGKVIVDFSETCRVQQVYTRSGCEVAGLPGYW